MITRFAGWMNEVNTTSFRIIVSVICTGIGMLLVLTAVMFFHWEPSEKQIKILEGLAIVALTMMGFDVLQFIGKRFTDASYAAAKSPSPVNVESPSVVKVDTSAEGRPPVAVGSPAPASSAAAAPSAAVPPAAPSSEITDELPHVRDD